MPPKIAIAALPHPCLALKEAMSGMGLEVNLASLRGYKDAQGDLLVRNASSAYDRQLANWWPHTLLIRHNELSKGDNDDGRRQCLMRYLLNPSSVAFGSSLWLKPSRLKPFLELPEQRMFRQLY